ncbi:MAG: response regulator transcription factor [Lachnospiraceae bacterium]|nr:response regulator transcription factor [Lachnospiraceae bacterium]
MLKIAVCDDEKNIRSYLISLIREQNVKCEIAEYASAEEYLSDGAEHDLLFLDIELDGVVMGMNGIGLARQIREREQGRQPVIIFVTGHEKYVYDAFDVDAFQYLVKPIDEQKFAEVFGRAQDKILSEAEQRKKTLAIRHGGANKVIPLDNIYYMESQGHKIMLSTKDGRMEYYARIGELEEELRGYFCRIHKGYLVNLACVDEYSKTEILLTNGDRLPLSKYKYEDFVRAYLRFMQ